MGEFSFLPLWNSPTLTSATKVMHKVPSIAVRRRGAGAPGPPSASQREIRGPGALYVTRARKRSCKNFGMRLRLAGQPKMQIVPQRITIHP